MCTFSMKKISIIYADERYKNRMSNTKAGANGINWKFDESLFKLYKHYQNKCKKETNPNGVWPKNKNYGSQYVKKCHALTERGTRCTIGTCAQSTTLCANHYMNGTSLYGVCDEDSETSEVFIPFNKPTYNCSKCHYITKQLKRYEQHNCRKHNM